nr:hypothetical protein [Polaromonas glacialis]
MNRGPFVRRAKLAAGQQHAFPLECKTAHAPGGRNVGHGPHPGRVQPFQELQRRRPALQRVGHQFLQHLPRGLGLCTQRHLDLGLLEPAFRRHHDLSLRRVAWAPGDGQLECFFQLADDPRGDEVLLLAEKHRAIDQHAVDDQVHVLLVVLEESELGVFQIKTHPLEVAFPDRHPALVADVLACGHAQAVVPDRLGDVGPARGDGPELRRQAADAGAGHIPAEQTAVALLLLFALEGVAEHAFETAAPADFLHAFHGNSPVC